MPRRGDMLRYAIPQNAPQDEKKLQKLRIFSVFVPIRTGINTHFDEIFQKHLDFWQIGCSTILIVRDSTIPSLRMHYDGGTGQKAPPATHLTVVLQSIDP